MYNSVCVVLLTLSLVQQITFYFFNIIWMFAIDPLGNTAARPMNDN